MVAGYYQQKRIEIKDFYDYSLPEYIKLEKLTSSINSGVYLSQSDKNKETIERLKVLTGEDDLFLDSLNAVEFMTLCNQVNSVIELKHYDEQELSDKKQMIKVFDDRLEKELKFKINKREFDLILPENLLTGSYMGLEKILEGFTYYDGIGKLKTHVPDVGEIDLSFAPYLLALFSLDAKYKGKHLALHPIGNVYTFDIFQQELNDYVKSLVEFFSNCEAWKAIKVLNFFLTSIERFPKDGQTSLHQKILKIPLKGTWRVANLSQVINLR